MVLRHRVSLAQLILLRLRLRWFVFRTTSTAAAAAFGFVGSIIVRVLHLLGHLFCRSRSVKEWIVTGVIVFLLCIVLLVGGSVSTRYGGSMLGFGRHGESNDAVAAVGVGGSSTSTSSTGSSCRIIRILDTWFQTAFPVSCRLGQGTGDANSGVGSADLKQRALESYRMEHDE